jgi:hypothetical protein
MDFYRASKSEMKYIKYETSINHNTALIAEDGEDIIASLEYRIKSMEEAEIVNFSAFKPCGEKEVFKGLVDEMLYWNPYLKRILFSRDNKMVKDDYLRDLGFEEGVVWILNTVCSAEVFKVDIDEIMPEQLTVDKTKLGRVSSWIQGPEDVIVSCVRIDDKLICIDGYSRLVAAFNKGFNYVYAYVEEENNNLEFYKTCKSWCEEEGVLSIKDLAGKVVTPEEHQRIWIDRCQSYLRAQRERNI